MSSRGARFLLAAAAMSAAAAFAGPASRFAPPGVYGRIDITRYKGKPVLVSKRPVIADAIAAATGKRAAPAYFWVPRSQSWDWASSCSRYGACKEPVHFVDHHWYKNAGPGRNLLQRNGAHDDHDDHDH